MTSAREPNAGLDQIRTRVESTWTCVASLRPDLTPRGKKELAKRVLALCESFDPGAPAPTVPQITAAQVTEIVYRNSQCIQKSCPNLLFSDHIAAELNSFFHPSE